jgi:hypothetical protein
LERKKKISDKMRQPLASLKKIGIIGAEKLFEYD